MMEIILVPLIVIAVVCSLVLLLLMVAKRNAPNPKKGVKRDFIRQKEQPVESDAN